MNYELTDFGYVIYRDGVVLITQDQVPGVPGRVLFTDDDHKRACAEAAIKELTPPDMATVAVEG